jgi:magnesium chelatase accessory protein
MTHFSQGCLRRPPFEAMSGLVWSTDGLDWPNRGASQFVEAAGIRWHVQRMGEGPALLLIHGTGAASHSWRDVMPLLAQQFTVIAPDLPGHAFTQVPATDRLSLPGMAADVAALLRKLDIRPRIIIGHSAGAAIAARMCLAGRVAPDVVISLNGAFMPFGGAASHLFSPLAKLLVLNPLVPRVFAWQASHDGAVDRLIANTGSTLDARGCALYGKLVRNPVHVGAALRMMANWRLEPLLHDLPRLVPKLVLVTAAHDRSVSPAVARQVQEILPSAVVEQLPGLGHLAHEEAPQRVVELLLRYARATSPHHVWPSV